jgi:hypothetical protein
MISTYISSSPMTNSNQGLNLGDDFEIFLTTIPTHRPDSLADSLGDSDSDSSRICYAAKVFSVRSSGTFSKLGEHLHFCPSVSLRVLKPLLVALSSDLRPSLRVRRKPSMSSIYSPYGGLSTCDASCLVSRAPRISSTAEHKSLKIAVLKHFTHSQLR